MFLWCLRPHVDGARVPRPRREATSKRLSLAHTQEVQGKQEMCLNSLRVWTCRVLYHGLDADTADREASVGA